MHEKRSEAGEVLRHVPMAFYGTIKNIEERWGVLLLLLALLGWTGSGFTDLVSEPWRPWIVASGLSSVAAWAVLASAADLVRVSRARERSAKIKFDVVKKRANGIISKKNAQLKELLSVSLIPSLEPVRTEWSLVSLFGEIHVRDFKVRVTNSGRGSAFGVQIKLVCLNDLTLGGEEGRFKLPEYILDPTDVFGGEHVITSAIGATEDGEVFFGTTHWPANAPLWNHFLTGQFLSAQFRIVCSNDGIDPIDFVIESAPPTLRTLKPQS